MADSGMVACLSSSVAAAALVAVPVDDTGNRLETL